MNEYRDKKAVEPQVLEQEYNEHPGYGSEDVEGGRPMTEEEWHTAKISYPLIEFLFHEQCVSDRKMRLFTCAASWRVVRYSGDESFTRLLEAAESFADGSVGPELLREVCNVCERRRQELYSDTLHQVVAACDAVIACADQYTARGRELYQPHDLYLPYPVTAAIRASNAAHYGAGSDDQEHRSQIADISDIFANPFRSAVAFAPEWRTDTVLALAQQIYDARDFTAMPILADALQDAGCDSADILAHCRGPGPHVRGCWVIDLVLNKE